MSFLRAGIAMISNALFSSTCTDWGTPQKANHKCAKYFTESQNGLSQDWGSEGAKNSAPFPSMVVIFVDASGKVL
jgi:hypothetical protein